MSWKQLGRSAIGVVCGLLSGGLVGAIVFGPIYKIGVVSGVIQWMGTTHAMHRFEFNTHTTIVFATGGIIYGCVLGIVLGSVFALTRYFTPGEIATGRQVHDVTIWSRNAQLS